MIAILCLLFGVVVNVAVAWGCAIWAPIRNVGFGPIRDPNVLGRVIDLPPNAGAATREDPGIKLGISPRGSMHLADACKAFALVKGRRQVLAEDVQRLIPPVWVHRILPRHGRDHDSAHAHELLQDILAKIPVPR